MAHEIRLQGVAQFVIKDDYARVSDGSLAK